jgi:ketol-acid reductoisomerase
MAKLKMIYEQDAPLDGLVGKTVAMLGYGSQGHAHSLNLRESGIKVIVAELPGRSNYDLAVQHGFSPVTAEEATRQGDLIVMTLPDEVQPAVYHKSVAPNLSAGKTLGATHGFNIHFKTIVPPKDVNVIMVAPKGPGHLVRSEFEKGGGVPCLLAVHQDATKTARQIGLAWARGIGGARCGIIQTTFKDECETDLFGEQAVLCGGLSSLIKAGFETLVEAGYPAEMAYFECVHEVKLIVDLIYVGGLDYMRYSISNTAEYGDLSRGPRIITPAVKKAMKTLLKEIQSGKFAKEWRREYETGLKNFKRLYKKDCKHPVEVVGKRIRAMMPWLHAKEPPKD